MQIRNTIALTLSRYALLLLIFTPFIVDKRIFFGYVEGKTVFIRAIVALTLLLLTGFVLFANRGEKLSLATKKLPLLKSRISLFVALFLGSVALSTIFAVDSFRAFFGMVERGEGLVGISFFVSFFLLALLLWEKREWIIFLSATAIGGGILFIQAFSKFLSTQGAARPYAALGNPAYLAAYLLFVIFAALFLIGETLKGWKSREKTLSIFILLFLSGIILVSSFTIFLTQVRGALIGLAAGIIAAAAYFLFSGENLPWLKGKKYQWAAASIMILVLFGIALATLLSSGLLKDVPGVNLAVKRFVSTGSLETRLIAAKVSMRAVDPRDEGVVKFLVGWGHDNYNIAYNSHFDPNYFRYEVVWFDRAHNRLFDALVMEGFVGLLVYLGLWGALLFALFRKKTEANILEHGQSAALVFFAVAYFVQNLFLFDTVATYVAFFAFLAFVVWRTQTGAAAPSSTTEASGFSLPGKVIFAAIPIAALAALILFVWATWLPYRQMKDYIALKTKGVGVEEFSAGLDKVFNPYSYVQDQIRIELIKSVKQFPEGEATKVLQRKMFDAAAELVRREPYEPRFAMNLGVFLEELGDLSAAEGYYRKAVALVPNRPDLNYLLAQNLMAQGKTDEGKEVVDNLLKIGSDIPLVLAFYGVALASATDEHTDEAYSALESFLDMPDRIMPTEELAALRTVYEHFMVVFYRRQDEANFVNALIRAEQIEKEWERRQMNAYLQGKLSAPPEKRSEDYAKALDAFKEMGWAAIGVVEGENE